MLNRDEIKKILPHREPMLLVDEAYVAEDGRAHGFYTVKGDEFFLQGHFPGNPVVPGVILCEIMAQSASVLLSGKLNGKTPFFSSLDGVKFKNPVRPGDTIETVVGITKERMPFVFAEGSGFVNGRLCVKASFSFAIV